MSAVGVGRASKWSEAQLLQALQLLEESRRSHLAYRRTFAARRHAEKVAGRRQPTRADLEALLHREWFKDSDAARTRRPSTQEKHG